MLRLRTLLPWVLGLLAGVTPSRVLAQPSGYELLEQLREAQTEALERSLEGWVEIATPIGPGLRLPVRAAVGGDGAFRIDVGDTADRLVIWRADEGVSAYDAGRDERRSFDAAATAWVATFGAPTLDVLVGPAFGLGIDALGSPDAAAVDGTEACGDRTCWRLLLTPGGGLSETLLWLDRQDLEIHRVEVTIGHSDGVPMALPRELFGHPIPPSGPIVLRSELRPVAVPRVTELVPPPSARLVDRWSSEAVGVAGGDPGDPARNDEPEGIFFDEIGVDEMVIDVRAVTPLGDALPDLDASAFVAHIGDHPVPVRAVEWISPHRSLPPVERPSQLHRTQWTPPETATPEAPGRQLLIFVQAGLHAIRIRGHMRVRPHIESLLASLAPQDRVAVASFDSHLKIWQDFDVDRAATASVLVDLIGFGGRPTARRNRRGISLFSVIDDREARDAATPERALRLIAEGLARLPDRTDLIFVGWGMGRFDRAGVRMTAEYHDAARALRDARTTVFSVDVTDAGSHSLEVGLQQVAADTGGRYFRANTQANIGLAMRRLGALLGGAYRLTLDLNGAPNGRLELDLQGRKGRVLHRPVRVRR